MAKKEPVASLRRYLASGITDRAKTVRREFERVRKTPDIESTHSLSTSLRRLLTTDRIVRELWARELFGSDYDILNGFRKRLGGVRDAQELLEKFREAKLDNAFAAAFSASLLRTEEEARAMIAAEADAFDTGVLKPYAKKGHVAGVLSGKPAMSLPELFAALFDKVEGKRAKAIRGRDDAKLHRLRVAYKHFRYAVELFSPDYTGLGKRDLKYLKTVQDKLGNAHDWLVLEEWAEEFFRKQPGRGGQTTLRELHRRCVRSHAEARDYTAAELDNIANLPFLA